jgi:hypothetical protein
MRRFVTTAIALGLVFVLVEALSAARAQAAGPGLFVTNLRLDPAQPAFNQHVSFTATFVNTASGDQNVTWRVYIFRVDAPARSDIETTNMRTTFPVGTEDVQSLGTFTYGPNGYTCAYFFARVGWIDANNQIYFFTQPDGTVYQKGFQVCDVNTIPTSVPPTPAPTATLPPPGPGLFVTNLRLDPAQPAFNQSVSFTATFVNTASGDQNVTWRVYIFRADAPARSDIETTNILTTFPVGTEDVQSLGTFTYGPNGYTCAYFFARVGWIDANNQIYFFTTPDGTVYQKGFQVCDANTIPTSVPPTPAPTATLPPPGPGLFVTDLRLQPFDTPQHGMATTFFPTFQNTSNDVQTFKWRVYVYRADTPNRSDIETTYLQTGFPPGTEEVQSLGTFTYGPTGYDCDYFFARVGWVDANNQITFFPKPDGTVFEKGFQVCK